jgi:hypothetical protein
VLAVVAGGGVSEMTVAVDQQAFQPYHREANAGQMARNC